MVRRARRNHKAPVSSLEILVQGWLDKAGIKYRAQYPIGRCHVDLFIEPRLVVEIQGCYWHSCQKCALAKTKQNRRVRSKDSNRFSFLLNQGHNLLILWEHELKKENEAVVIKKIRSLVDGL